MSKSNRAIQQDAPDQETNTGVISTHNPRNDFLEQLANSNHEIIKNELAEAGFAQNDDVIEEKQEIPKELEKTDPHLLSEDDLTNMRVKTKVNGIEEEHSIAEVVKSFQKDSAASKRLEDVAKRQAELDAREAAILAKESSLQSNNAQVNDHPSTQDDAIAEVVSAFYEGDEEKTKEAFNKLLGQRPQAIDQPDTNAIANQVVQKINNDKAMANFSNNYQEIVNDTFLAQVADAYLAQELQDGTELNEALTKAGESTREWVKQKQVSPTSNIVDAKLARKSSLDNIPEASLKNKTPDSNIESEGNASAIIAEMRKARGLPA